MKKLVFLLTFLLILPAFGASNKRGGELARESVFSLPCNLKSSKLDLFATLSTEIDKRYNLVKGSQTFQDSDNAFPAVGMINLAGDLAGHGSGTVVGIKDKDGKVLKNKVVTSAHNIFDVKGNLIVPLEAMEFLLGYDVNNEDYKFNITKIECPELKKDQCILTLDKDVPNHISPMEPVKGNPEKYVQNADYLFFTGYASWVPMPNNSNERMGREGQRFYSQCNRAKRWQGNKGEDFFFVGCNSFAGASGGAFIASKQQANGAWKDYYIGLVGGAGKSGESNISDTFRYDELNSFNKLVVTSQNQRQFFASN